MTDLETKLSWIKHYGTRYEIVLETADGACFLIGYTMRKSKVGMLAAIRRNGPAILQRVAIADDAKMVWRAGAFRIDGGVTIKFSGRTQREAYCAGELPFIGDGEGSRA